MSAPATLGWLGILRLGLVQTALGAVVVLTTSAVNRVMVIELALPATLPGLLVGLHYAVQMMRPRMGFGSDLGGRRTPWIIGGMGLLALGGLGAAGATALMEASLPAGILAAVVAFVMVGLGVGAAGTSLLALLAARTAPRRRPAAASIVWIMMIAGFVVTTATAGRLLDPYSPERLVAVSAGVSALAFLLAVVAVLGMEPRTAARAAALPAAARPSFREAVGEVWAEPEARRFTVFVFVSMLAYAAQDLILEPFAGAVFGLSLGETTRLSSVQHGGVLAGMVVVALVGGLFDGPPRALTVGGCLAAAGGMVLLMAAPFAGAGFPLATACFLLGLANGVFAASAIASMMHLAGRGRASREGVRLGLWGAAQAIAFGLGGLAGTVGVDVVRWATGSAPAAYAVVFAADAAMFLAAAGLAAGIGRVTDRRGLAAAHG
ncbi:MFS transporter [Roseomonas nepalensis]|uniref:MFS transporter n=1 Tax=Muricoccus nepalensis TaxID=1854500 RepID=A0A502GBZ7_9PROT|nr:BCD family MFS transporter [Roseomonas nepalensis]TPG58556.1 MFS transporter [Roseomonas nepalensis]